MSQINHKHLHSGWIKTTIIAVIVAILASASFLAGLQLNEISISIAGVGLITFFGMLVISSYHALHQPDSKGTMRKAIASSIISVYVVLLALAFSERLSNMPNEQSAILLQNFTWIVMTVVGFYFGSKGAIEFLKFWKGDDKNGKT